MCLWLILVRRLQFVVSDFIIPRTYHGVAEYLWYVTGVIFSAVRQSLGSFSSQNEIFSMI